MKANMRFRNLLKKHGLSIISVIIFFLLWEIGSRLNVLPKDYIGTPSIFIVEFFHLFTPRIITTYLLPSVEALIIGLPTAILLGVVIAFAIGINPTVRKIFKPFLFAVNTIPVVVFFPLFVFAFGISLESVIIVIIAMCTVPVLINVVQGIASADPLLLTMAKSFKVSKFFVVKDILFFSALPYLIAGIRAAIGRSIIALIIAELYGLNRGIGYLIAFYGGSFHADKLMALVIFILLINCVLFAILWLIEKSLYKIGYRKEALS